MCSCVCRTSMWRKIHFLSAELFYEINKKRCSFRKNMSGIEVVQFGCTGMPQCLIFCFLALQAGFFPSL